MFSTDSKFDKCFKCLVDCEFMEKSLFHDWFHTVCTDRQRTQTHFLKFNLSHKLQLLNVEHNFCLVMCYIVLIWTMILLTLGINIVTLSFNWPKPVHYVLTDRINTSICIRIRRNLKVKIRIRRIQILTSFVTSLMYTVNHKKGGSTLYIITLENLDRFL